MSSSRPTTPRTTTPARPLAKNHKETAKQQAYLLRDLITSLAGKTLTGSAVLDTYAHTFHGANWSTVMASLRPPQSGPFYAADARSTVRQQSECLAQLAGIPQYCAIRVIMSLPCASYGGARTLSGAIMATLLAGRPSWSFTPSDSLPVVFERETGVPFRPKAFSSDPKTNAEFVVGEHAETGQPVRVPVETVCYVPPEEEPSQQFSRAIAKHWYRAGNAVEVTRWRGDTPLRLAPAQLHPQEGDRDTAFEAATEVLADPLDGITLTFRPIGYQEVHHPDERWNRSMTELRAMLPELEAADRAYQSVMDALCEAATPDVATRQLHDATRAYNAVLLRAVEAYWRDTREVNGRDGVFATLAPNGDELAFSKVDPLAAIRQLLGDE